MLTQTSQNTPDLAKPPLSFLLPGFLAGEYVSAWLSGMVISEGIRVLCRFPNDNKWQRLLVWGVMAVSIIHTCWFEYIVHYYAVENFDNFRNLDVITPHFGAHVLLSRFLVTTVQLFFCHRVYIFSNKDWKGTTLSALLTILHISAAIDTALKLIRGHFFSQLVLRVSLGLLYGLTIATDVIITGYLLYYLGKKKSEFLKTRSLIKQIMLLSFETGSITTACAIVSVFMLGHTGLGTLYALTVIASQLYLLSFLVTLNSRFDFAKSFGESREKALKNTYKLDSMPDQKRNHYECGIIGVKIDQVISTNIEQGAPPALPRFATVRSDNSLEPSLIIPRHDFSYKYMHGFEPFV
ncbi:hypothetical protein O181_025329 [Austropuccinia psidii MF-1]|uniref:DUF6534 domain-containing protein n=1 Tax=Austropuccinia psidii MF-1 TaxID=1389203 RepID=A0A9Q3CKC4_9BASI|nr:hypothetical protein [Austropuccinia psidii MF-1]